jgi:hypothetical protein
VYVLRSCLCVCAGNWADIWPQRNRFFLVFVCAVRWATDVPHHSNVALLLRAQLQRIPFPLKDSRRWVSCHKFDWYCWKICEIFVSLNKFVKKNWFKCLSNNINFVV